MGTGPKAPDHHPQAQGPQLCHGGVECPLTGGPFHSTPKYPGRWALYLSTQRNTGQQLSALPCDHPAQGVKATRGHAGAGVLLPAQPLAVEIWDPSPLPDLCCAWPNKTGLGQAPGGLPARGSLSLEDHNGAGLEGWREGQWPSRPVPNWVCLQNLLRGFTQATVLFWPPGSHGKEKTSLFLAKPVLCPSHHGHTRGKESGLQASDSGGSRQPLLGKERTPPSPHLSATRLEPWRQERPRGLPGWSQFTTATRLAICPWLPSTSGCSSKLTFPWA